MAKRMMLFSPTSQTAVKTIRLPIPFLVKVYGRSDQTGETVNTIIKRAAIAGFKELEKEEIKR